MFFLFGHRRLNRGTVHRFWTLSHLFQHNRGTTARFILPRKLPSPSAVAIRWNSSPRVHCLHKLQIKPHFRTFTFVPRLGVMRVRFQRALRLSILQLPLLSSVRHHIRTAHPISLFNAFLSPASRLSLIASDLHFFECKNLLQIRKIFALPQSLLHPLNFHDSMIILLHSCEHN